MPKRPDLAARDPAAPSQSVGPTLDRAPRRTRTRAVQLTPDLLALMQPRPFDRLFVQWLSHPAMVQLACMDGRGWAMIDGGYVIGAAGVMEFWPGRGMVWMLVSTRATWRHFGEAVRLMTPILDELQTRKGFVRLEASTPRDWQRGQNFLKALGFVREDMWGMPHYQRGLTHALFARIRLPARDRAATPTLDRSPDVKRAA